MSEETATPHSEPVEPRPNQPERGLAEELGVVNLSDPIFGGRGRIFSTAGKQTPIAEFTREHLILHAPQKPFDDQTYTEELLPKASPRGILLDVFGAERKIAGAKFMGNAIYCLAERDPESGRHLAAWFDSHGNSGLLMFETIAVTYEIAVKLRNRTHDGEISILPGLEPKFD